MIGVADLVVRRGGRTVVDVSRLQVGRGEALGIVGPNGAGKSTLLMALLGLIRPWRGAVLVDGEALDRRRAAAWRRRTALVLQDPLLLDTSALDNVAAPLRFRGVPAAAARARAATWLEVFGTAGLARRSARALSQGEARRVSLARAFVASPDVLFLDEPFASLDAPTRQGLLHDLGAALRASPRTTVFVSHDMDEVAALATRVAVMVGGRFEQVGVAADVLARPASAAVARALGFENILLGEVELGHVQSPSAGGGGFISVSLRSGAGTPVVAATPTRAMHDRGRAVIPGEEVAVCLRAADVRLERLTPAAGGAGEAAAAAAPRAPENLLTGRVGALEPTGDGGARVLVIAPGEGDVIAPATGDLAATHDAASDGRRGGFSIWAHVSREGLARWRPTPDEPVAARFPVAATWAADAGGARLSPGDVHLAERAKGPRQPGHAAQPRRHPDIDVEPG